MLKEQSPLEDGSGWCSELNLQHWCRSSLFHTLFMLDACLEPWILWLSIQSPYLVVPWFLGQHFNTLEPRCFTLCSKRSSFRKEFHVYTLSQINESQAMREIIYVTRIVVQKPSTKTSSSNQRLQCHDMVASHVVKGNTCLSPSMKLSGLMSPWMILQLWSSSTIWRIFTAK